MDMYMPSCNGVEAARALRQMSAFEALPIIYLSGETDVRLPGEALALGEGVKARAAALLGVNRTTLVEKIKRRRIEA